MSIARWRHLTASELSQVAQVKTFTITATSTGQTATWTLTLTDDNGDTHTVTYTEDSQYTDDIADGLVAAWNASTNPNIARITAAKTVTDTFTLTADTAGIPFTVTLADSSDGTHTETDTTASVGYNDYGVAANWSDD